MKRFTLALAMTLTLVMPLFAERVTSETAKNVASTFLNNNGAKASQLTDLSKTAGFQNLYIFTAEQGFVVMSADDCVQPILGYSLTDIFVTEDMPDNLVWWLRGYNDEIQYAIDSKMKASDETTKMWKDLAGGNAKAERTTVVVAPLIQTKWSQSKYYNRLCPALSDGPDGHAYTGCVATAMAQIMKYWNHPIHGTGSVTYNSGGFQGYPYIQGLTANFGATTYDWDNMNPYYENYYANGEDFDAITSPYPTEAEINAIATLMYHCGVSVKMNYGGPSTGGSGAYSSAVATALINHFNYSPATEFKQKSSTNSNTSITTTYYSDSEWIAMLKVELDASRPLHYGGSDPDPNNSTGHAFVCDGYDNRNYFHFNWGWAGHYNGYFTISNLNTGANSSEAGAGNGTYTRDQYAIFGIQPMPCAASEPTNLTYTLSGINNLTLNWTAINGAVSYNIYCNNNYVGNSTTNSYTESAPFGPNVYYVRSVDANGNLSLPSNTVTLYIGYQTPIVNDLTASLSENNVNLSWTAPEWCYPQTPSAILTYGNGIMNTRHSAKYWAHRYLSDNLSQYVDKAVYKISFYAYATGSYTCYIYKGTTTQYIRGENAFFPTTLLTSKNIEVTNTLTWIDIDLEELVTIDGQDDIWVIMHDPSNGNGRYSAAFSYSSESNSDGGYVGRWILDDGRKGYVRNGNYAFLIRTYVTDGTYTYNLYDGTSQVASNINATNYTVSNPTDNTAHRYTLKTNYYGGETNASNLAGITLGTASLSSLNMGNTDKMTVTENSQLTVSGTLRDVNADNLILEDGAQLINSSTGVKATVKKNITAYTQDGGWYLVASPITESITPNADNGLLSNDYDLYTFNQSEQMEWHNYETHSFTIDNKTGYLYANNGNLTLSFAGTLMANTTAITLAYDSKADFRGFNLIGNPYPCNAYVDRSFYVLNEDGSEFIIGSNPIPPCMSFMVQAQGTGESVIFGKSASKNKPSIVASVKTMQDKGEKIIDMARVSFEENDNLTKFTMSNHTSQLYIPQDKQNYAVAFANGQSEMPLNFKTAKNDTYVLDFKVENMETNYLHLIDNMTGIDVDLLTTSSYVFEASTDDDEARFRLMLTPNANGDNKTFAYYANGEIHIIETQDFASLQIVDMTGRILVSRDMVRHISTANMAPGIYVLRLISGEQVKTQKIVLQ